MVTNWYFIIFAFAIIVKMIGYLFKNVQNQELEKRKLITEEIDKVKERYRKEKITILDLFQFQQFLKEEEVPAFKKETNEIVKKYKGKPYLIVFPFLLNILIAVSFATYLRIVNPIDYTIWVPVIGTIITFFTIVTRKNVVFALLIVAVAFWIYTKINGAVNLFICFITIFTAIEKVIKEYNKRTKKTQL